MVPETRYARAPDGAFIAYQTYGDGPVDMVWQFDWFGDVDLQWQDPETRAWNEALGSAFRVIFHDRRATGLSSRNVPPPNLEQRAADTLVVMDAAGSDRAVLASVHEGGAPNALLAASRPDRVDSLIWMEPTPRATRARDYPWGWSRRRIAEDARMIEHWGTRTHAEWFTAAEEAAGNGSTETDLELVAMAERHWCTPDVAAALSAMWNETDVRGVLPAVTAPALVIAHRDRPNVELSKHVAGLLPDARLVLMSGQEWTRDEIPAWLEEIRTFVGVERPPVGLDTILATVLFTDIVGSTERQAQVGDHAWKAVVERHHELVRRELERWRGMERDTAGDGFFATFDGPARAIRCALELVDRVHELGLEIRAGIHTGECEIVDQKVGGLAVSIGARIATIARPSEVLVSQTVKDLVAGSGLAFADAGDHELKGIPDRWHLWRAAMA